MSRKLIILTGGLVLALAASVGTYASTYLTAGATVGATLGGAEFVSSVPASGQPNWESLLPHREYGVEVLRPNATGDETKIDNHQPGSGANWDKVADGAPDDWATTVYTNGSAAKIDLYNLFDHGMGSGTIDNVTVYFRFTATDGGVAKAWAAIATDGHIFLGGEEMRSGPSFITKSYTWASNPNTHKTWTWAEIDDLQAGVQLQRDSGSTSNAVCTQVYVRVEYVSAPITSGAVPNGNLFTVTPDAGYTGDLLVKVYLTNTDAMVRAYKYLNMKVYVAGSVEAGQTPNYQLLSLENGVVVFNITGGTAPSYTVQVTGGSYNVVSGDTTVWGPGWSIAPELYCEVTAK